MSPSVWWDNRAIVKMAESYRSTVRPRMWLDAGTEEGDAPHETIADLRLLREALVAKGWRDGVDLAYCEVHGAGHNEGAWAWRLADVLRYLYPKSRG